MANSILRNVQRFLCDAPKILDPKVYGSVKSLYDKILKEGIKIKEEPFMQHKYLFPDYDPSKCSKRLITERNRCGAFGIKLGMSNLWMEHNCKHLPVTMVQIKECEVLAIQKPKPTLNGWSPHVLLVGGKNVDPDRFHELSVFSQEFYRKHNLQPKAIMGGFRVHPTNVLPVGTEIKASHFVPGQKLTVVAKTKDRGFQGVMRRHGLKGGPATHGCTKNHRRRGNTGSPRGVILPGTTMPGHMGMRNQLISGLWLLRINTVYNVLYIQGTIPGPRGSYVKIHDSGQNKPIPGSPLPYPCFQGNEAELPEDIYSKMVHPIHLPWNPPE